MKVIVNALMICSLALVSMTASGLVAAEAFPTHSVRLIVPYSAGSATDVLAREIAARLGTTWGQGVVVENQAGANGTIATAAVAQATPDGYTLIMIAANHVINGSLYKNLAYDDIKSFRAIARIGEASFVLCVTPSFPAKSVADLVALAKARPGTINYSSPGNGTPGHLAFEMLKALSGAKLVHIPYKGAAQATTDLIGGQVQAGFVVESSAIPLINSGKLRALAISSAKRSPKLPDVPTIAESGYPGFDVVSWIGLVAPAQVPDEIVKQISAQVLKIIHEPDMRAKISGLGLVLFPASAEEFGKYMVSEHAKWAKAVKSSGATID